MNNCSRLLLSLSVPLVLLQGCTSYYRNVEACRDRVRADYPNSTSAPLKITGSGASYHGSRVVVRGEYPDAPKPPATKIVQAPLAAECTFTDNTMSGFQWLTPAKLAEKTPNTDEE